MRHNTTSWAEQRPAVVLGGSVAGLLTARVLAQRYPAVIIVERDRLPAGPAHRRGVPQAHQIHALLAGGQQAVEQLLPGITADLASHGSPVGDPLADMQVCFNGHRFRRGPSGLTLVSASRRLLEHHVRRHVLTLPEVTLVDHCDVVGLTAHSGKVDGVQILRRADNSVEEVIDADLVVDATGRGSRLPTWLAGLGYRPPDEEKVAVDLGYATRCYRMPLDALDGAYGAIETPRPQRPRGLALARLEGDIWMLTLIGLGREHPPADPHSFDRFLASIGVQTLRRQIEAAEPIDDPIAFRFPASTRRHYEQTALPDRLLVVGDSLCSFNPVYGQGISVAAYEALTIDRSLDETDHHHTFRLMRNIAGIVDVPWRMARAADRPFAPTAAAPGAGERALATYIDRIQRAATQDAVVGGAFLRVSGLLEPPRSLLRPAILARALRANRICPNGNVIDPRPDPLGRTEGE